MNWVFLLVPLCVGLLLQRLLRMLALVVSSVRSLSGGKDGAVAFVESLPLGDADLVTGTAGVMRPVSFVVPVIPDSDPAELQRTLESLLSVSTPDHEVLLLTSATAAAEVVGALPEELRPGQIVEPLIDLRLADRGLVLQEARSPERGPLRWLTIEDTQDGDFAARTLNAAVNAARYSLLMQVEPGMIVTGDTVRQLIRGVLLSGSTAAGVARVDFVSGPPLRRWLGNLEQLRAFSRADVSEALPRTAILWRRHALLSVGGVEEDRPEWLDLVRRRLAQRRVDGRPCRIDRFRDAVIEDRGPRRAGFLPAAPSRMEGAKADLLLRSAELTAGVWCVGWFLVGGPGGQESTVSVACTLIVLFVLPALYDLMLVLLDGLRQQPGTHTRGSSAIGLLMAALWEATVLRSVGSVARLLHVSRFGFGSR